MAMTRDAATTFLSMFAGTAVSPALTSDEVTFCLDQCLVADPAGLLPGATGYVDTVWATRAVGFALDAKIAKVSSKVDLTADGATISASQVGDNLRALRKTWRSRLLPGTP